MPLPPQPLVVDVLALAVAKTSLRELQPVEDFRTTVNELWSTLSDGQYLRLQVLWDHFSARPGFDAKVAACPMCWLKTLESRLGGTVELPVTLATLKLSEVATQAAKVFVRREELDKILGHDTPPPSTRSTTPTPGSLHAVRPSGSGLPEPGAPPASVEPGAAPASLEPGAAPVDLDARPTEPSTSSYLPPGKQAASPERQRLLAVVAGVAIVASLAVLGVTFRSGCAVKPSTIEVRTSLPVHPGQRIGNDVRLVLKDRAWVAKPEDARRTQLGEALLQLHAGGVENIVVVDDKGKLVATAQWFNAKANIKFYR